MDRDVEKDVLPTCKELGIGFVPYSPLGRGFLTGRFDKEANFDKNDARQGLPRFSADNLEANRPISSAVEQIARRQSRSPAQVALAWLLAWRPYCPHSRHKKSITLSITSAASIKLPAEELVYFKLYLRNLNLQVSVTPPRE